MGASTHRIAGSAIDVVSAGTGPRLTVLHRDTGRAWTALHDRLAAKFTVVAPSLPGFDASERPDWLRNVTDLAGLVGLLDDAIGGDPGVWLGLGFGGWVAAELAAHSPARVSRLILHSPMGIRPDEGEIADQFLIEAEDYMRLGFASAEAYERHKAADDDGRMARLDGNREMTTRIAWKPAMFVPSLRYLLRGVSIPSLIVCSAGDAIVPRSCAQAYRSALAGSRYAEIPGGHAAEHEAPDALAALVEDFLGC